MKKLFILIFMFMLPCFCLAPSNVCVNALDDEQFKIEIIQTDGGKIYQENNAEVLSEIQVNKDDTAAFKFVPDNGYAVASIIVDGKEILASDKYIFTLVEFNHSISATFKEISHNITALPCANGAIVPKLVDNQVECSIVPAAGYEIEDVKVNDVSVGVVSSYTFIDYSLAQTISATFKIKTFKIAITASHASFSSSADLSTCEYGDDITLEIAPDAKYEIQSVIVNGKKLEVEKNKVTIQNVNSDLNIFINCKPETIGFSNLTTNWIIILVAIMIAILIFLIILIIQISIRKKHRRSFNEGTTMMQHLMDRF